MSVALIVGTQKGADSSAGPCQSDYMCSIETFSRFLARQPILTRDRKYFAYEILPRYGPENYCRPAPGSPVAVTAMDELFLMGVRTMTEGLPAFINCTRDFLLNDYLTLMPKELAVGEVLETVEPDADVLAACRRMKEGLPVGAGRLLRLADNAAVSGHGRFCENRCAAHHVCGTGTGRRCLPQA